MRETWLLSAVRARPVTSGVRLLSNSKASYFDLPQEWADENGQLFVDVRRGVAACDKLQPLSDREPKDGKDESY